MHVRRKTSGLLLAAAAAAVLTTAAALPASASATGYYQMLVQVGSWPHSFPDGLWPVKSQVAGSSSYCLDVPGASTQAGLGVQIYWCNNTRAQAWAVAGPPA